MAQISQLSFRSSLSGTPTGAQRMRQDAKFVLRSVIATFAAVAVAIGAFLFEAG